MIKDQPVPNETSSLSCPMLHVVVVFLPEDWGWLLGSVINFYRVMFGLGVSGTFYRCITHIQRHELHLRF